MPTSTATVQVVWPVPQTVFAEFRRLSHIFLREHSVGLCHDLIRASYPMAAGSFDKAIGNQKKVANGAFASIRARTLANWLFDKDYASADAYKFKGFSPYINQLYNQKDWVRLEAVFRGPPHNIQPDGKSPVEVADTANLELLYKWKSRKGPAKAKKPIYIRKWKSIDAVKNNKSIFSRVGTMAGGWLMAAKMLGNKPDKFTKAENSIWLQTAGRGRSEIEEGTWEGKDVSGSFVQYSIINDYANIGGYMEKVDPKAALNRRFMMCDSMFPDIWEETIKNTGFDVGG